jgi:hypothetical protein
MVSFNFNWTQFLYSRLKFSVLPMLATSLLLEFFEMIMHRWSKIQISQVVLVCQHRLTTTRLMFKNS